MNCPKCGYEMGPFDVECERCKRTGGRATGSTVRCRHCGAELAQPQAQFCGDCGKATSEKPVSIWVLLVIAVGAIVIFYFGFQGTVDVGRQATQSFEQAQQFEAQAVQQTQAAGVTLAQFEAVSAGMTRQQVEAILGPGQLLSQTSLQGIGTSEMYQWTGQGDIGANMNVMYQDGRVVSKAQFGLR